MKCPICGTRNNYYFEKCIKCGFILNFDEEEEEDLFVKSEIPIFLAEEIHKKKHVKRNRIRRKA